LLEEGWACPGALPPFRAIKLANQVWARGEGEYRGGETGLLGEPSHIISPFWQLPSPVHQAIAIEFEKPLDFKGRVLIESIQT